MVFVCMCVCVHVCVVLWAACVSVCGICVSTLCVNVFAYTLFAPDDWAIFRVCSTSTSSIKINTTRNITVVAAAESDLYSQAWMSKDWIHRGVAGWAQMKLESDIHWQVCWLCRDSACFVLCLHARWLTIQTFNRTDNYSSWPISMNTWPAHYSRTGIRKSIQPTRAEWVDCQTSSESQIGWHTRLISSKRLLQLLESSADYRCLFVPVYISAYTWVYERCLVCAHVYLWLCVYTHMQEHEN